MKINNVEQNIRKRICYNYYFIPLNPIAWFKLY